jgi:hypothetical protein
MSEDRDGDVIISLPAVTGLDQLTDPACEHIAATIRRLIGECGGENSLERVECSAFQNVIR